ncbi:Protein of unknown function [Pyronema omphalodes CBS 100304]|uniref:Uncharacterized protein n=1 Tax=Pyronema omphalodes (strain CBS 100304) TaxID=1076935 RepID=U4L6E8_PYROM|nr:Protein of unknown function [Pyronema omphalodes CBS 100304]
MWNPQSSARSSFEFDIDEPRPLLSVLRKSSIPSIPNLPSLSNLAPTSVGSIPALSSTLITSASSLTTSIARGVGVVLDHVTDSSNWPNMWGKVMATAGAYMDADCVRFAEMEEGGREF